MIGRLADPVTHNDVNYIIDGIRRLLYIEINGFWAEIPHLFREPMHAPLSGYQAALGFYLFGFHDWAPYASDIIYLLIFLGVCASLLRGTSNVVVIAGIVAMVGLPLAYTTISEFAPEVPCGLFTALGVLLTLRIQIFDRAIGERALAGLCFGLGFIGKPSSFAFVPLVVCATLGVIVIRDVWLRTEPCELRKAAYHGTLHLLLALWLPALYIIPNFSEFTDYFYRAMFDKKNVEAFAGNFSFGQHLLYFFTGPGGEYMFGNFLWAYVGTIAIGVAAAVKRGDRPFIARQFELLVLVIVMWVLPTLAVAKNTLFGAPFAYLFAFMVVMSLRSIYETIGGVGGAVAVAMFGFFLMVSGTSLARVPNTPGFFWYNSDAHIIREKWPEAMDRFRAVMLGNAPNYRSGSVYMTNVGYYHIPVLWYWFLKKDPALDWRFQSLWADSNPQDHLNYVDQQRPDFVIAARRGNGLTYAPTLIAGAAGSEDAVFAAMWNDPNYMPLDQFYGPTGRVITVFQRRTAFAGWRNLGGMGQYSGATRPWSSAGTITHLEAYAPTPVQAELAIDVTGPAGQVLDVIVNHHRVGELTLDTGGQAALNKPIELLSGQNDVVIRYSSDASVTFRRLIIVRKINREM